MTQPRGQSSDGAPSDTLFDRARDAGVQPVGAALVALGAALVLAAFTIFDWFREGPGFFGGAGTHSTFSDVHTKLVLTQQQAEQKQIAKYISFGASRQYFSWLGWVLLLAAVAFGCVAVSRIGGRFWAVKWVAAVVATAGAALTVLALDLVTFEANAPNNADAPSFGEYLTHSGLGAWAAIAGFVLIVAGSLLPHHR
jgi:hypothetical protein